MMDDVCICNLCSKIFTEPEDLELHMKNQHPQSKWTNHEKSSRSQKYRKERIHTSSTPYERVSSWLKSQAQSSSCSRIPPCVGGCNLSNNAAAVTAESTLTEKDGKPILKIRLNTSGVSSKAVITPKSESQDLAEMWYWVARKLLREDVTSVGSETSTSPTEGATSGCSVGLGTTVSGGSSKSGIGIPSSASATTSSTTITTRDSSTSTKSCVHAGGKIMSEKLKSLGAVRFNPMARKSTKPTTTAGTPPGTTNGSVSSSVSGKPSSSSSSSSLPVGKKKISSKQDTLDKIKENASTMDGVDYKLPNLNVLGTYEKEDGEQVWVCLVCSKEEGQVLSVDDMICCDICYDWYHWACVGIKYSAPPPEQHPWYCKRCLFHLSKEPAKDFPTVFKDKEGLRKEKERKS